MYGLYPPPFNQTPEDLKEAAKLSLIVLVMIVVIVVPVLIIWG